MRKLHRKLVTLHHQIRQHSPPCLAMNRVVSQVNYREWMHGKTVKRVVLFLPVIRGCQWRLSCGGCFPCGMAYGLGINPEHPSIEIKPVVEKTIEWLVGEEAPEWVCVYNEGSFLNPWELSPFAQSVILTLIAQIESVKRITIESRPEFITPDSLKPLEEITNTYGVEVEIGIGIEVRNDFVREVCVNKGFSWEEFGRGIKAIRERGLRSLAYVFLKPPFLTEREAIEEAVSTVEACFNEGVDAISLEVASIHEWTLLEYLWLKGFYRVPWLWSALEVVRRVWDIGEIRIGGEPQTYFPQSEKAAYNCDECTKRIWMNIRHYNETHVLEHLQNGSCKCREEWIEEISLNDKVKKSLEERIIERIKEIEGKLNIEDYLLRKSLYTSFRELGG